MKKLLVLLLTVFALNSCEKDPEIIGIDAEKKLPKVDVCHYDEYTDTWKTISINENALKAHLGHGDYLGDCGARTYVPDDSFEQLLINLGYDNVLDDYVLTSNINTVTSLIVPRYTGSNELNMSKSSVSSLKDFIILNSQFKRTKNLHKSSNQKDLLKSNFNKIKDLKELHSTIDIVKSLNVQLVEENSGIDSPIYDLTGIEDFIALVNLEVYSMQVPDLDLSNNRALMYLRIMDGALVSLNITNNLALTELKIQHSALTSVDLSKNLNLQVFWAISSPWSEIDVTNNVNIKYFSLSGNQLTSLDLTKNIELTQLNIQRSLLASLDLSKNLKLQNLGLVNFPVKQIDLTENKELVYLFTHYTYFSSIDLKGNEKLSELLLWNTSLTSLDLRENSSLSRLLISFAPPALTSLDITKNTLLNEMHLYKVPLTSLDISKNVLLKELSIYGGMPVSILDFTNNTELEYLNLDSSLNSIDLSKNTKLWKLTMDGTNVYSLNLNSNSALINFYCKNNINLNQLFFKNNNYLNVTHFSVRFNSNLTCIEVDNPVYSTANWSKDSWTDFREDCGY